MKLSMTQFTLNYHLEIYLLNQFYENIQSRLNYGATDRYGTNQHRIRGLFKVCLNSV